MRTDKKENEEDPKYQLKGLIFCTHPITITFLLESETWISRRFILSIQNYQEFNQVDY
jgi:hypothetical protein